MRHEDLVATVAYTSRIVLICLQYLSNLAIPDHNAEAFRYLSSNNTGFNIVDHLLGGFVRWDAHYFMHIAKFGYTYENTLAFFPLYPYVAGFLGDFAADIIGHSHIDSALLLIFITANVYLFKKAALVLFELTQCLFNTEIALNSAILFCFNPASVFFAAPYTETLFSYLTFLSMLNVLKFYKKYSSPDNVFELNDLLFLLPIALSTATRSNGLLNIGFILYAFVCLYKKVSVKKFQLKLGSIQHTYKRVLRYAFVMHMTTFLSFLPFLFFQVYSYTRFCRHFPVSLTEDVLEQAREMQFVLPGQYKNSNQSWCNESVPLAYSYVQSHYWKVGFLQYYELKQWPNFVLAMPMLCIITFSGLKHIWTNVAKRHYFNIFTLENPTKIGKSKVHIPKTDLYQPRLTVFYVHALFLALYSIFFIHIQVSTRLLCAASPVFYWVCSKQLASFKSLFHFGSFRQACLKLYLVIYFIVGTVLFCNFLPWT